MGYWRFWSKVDRSGGPDACWPWTGAQFASGHGAFRIRNTTTTAHRVAFALEVEPIPAATPVRTCRHDQLCCNPAHLASRRDEEEVSR